MLKSFEFETVKTQQTEERGSSPSSNRAISGKEMSTARLVARMHSNLQSLETLVNGLFVEQIWPPSEPLDHVAFILYIIVLLFSVKWS